MNIYEAVKIRQSNKKYIKDSLDEKLLGDIKEHIYGMFPLFDDTIYSVDIFAADNIKKYATGMVSIKAPYYICFSAKTNYKSYINTGYMLENISLYLITKGLASSFMNLNNNKLMEKDGMSPLMMFAFGKAKGLAYRESKFANRKKIDKITYGYDRAAPIVQEILEYARLAPSPHNMQPWRFEVSGNDIHIFCIGTRLLSKKNIMISVGNAIAHMLAVTEERWQEAHIEEFDVKPVKFKDCEYVCTLVLSAGSNSMT